MLAVIATARLRLEPVAAADVGPLWRLLVMPAVRRFLFDDKLLPRADVETIVAENGALAAAGLGMRIIRDGDGLAGFVSIHPVSHQIAVCIPTFRGELEVSVALQPRCWGRGYATEAVAAALEEWRAAGDGRRVVAVADAPNLRSRRMLERLGFVAVGVHDGPAYRLVAFVPAGDAEATPPP